MIATKEEQLNEFFENGMSPADEQNFLISVAASDELRRAFRSQLELMKAVRSDKDSLRSVAQVRNRTLAALGLSATAAGQFFEQELLRGERAANQEAAQTLVAQAPQTGMQWASRIGTRLSGRLLHTPALTLAGGLLLGILSTTAVEHFANVPQSTVRVVPSVNQPAKSASQAETISSKNGLNNRDEHSYSQHMTKERIASHHATPIHEAGMSEHQVANGSPSAAVKPVSQAVVKSAANSIPEISKNNPGVMQSQPLKIIQKDDSTKATK